MDNLPLYFWILYLRKVNVEIMYDLTLNWAVFVNLDKHEYRN